MKQGHKEVLFI